MRSLFRAENSMMRSIMAVPLSHSSPYAPCVGSFRTRSVRTTLMVMMLVPSARPLVLPGLGSRRGWCLLGRRAAPVLVSAHRRGGGLEARLGVDQEPGRGDD